MSASYEPARFLQLRLGSYFTYSGRQAVIIMDWAYGKREVYPRHAQWDIRDPDTTIYPRNWLVINLLVEP
jgi:hypothetical protein